MTGRLRFSYKKKMANYLDIVERAANLTPPVLR
jgi:hypothetical protein